MTPAIRGRNPLDKSANLLLITIDSWRTDHAGFLAPSEPTPTPCLDEVAADSVVFENAYAAGIPTYYSFPAIMASRYPLRWGRGIIGLAPEETTLATTLARQRYATAGFVAAAVYASHHFGYHEGFATFEDFLSDYDSDATSPQKPTSSSSPNASSVLRRAFEGPRRLIGSSALCERLYASAHWHLQFLGRWIRERKTLARWARCPSADQVLPRALDWLRERRDERWFLWIHLMDPHHPYFPPPAALAQFRLPWRPLRMAYVNDTWMFFNPGRRHKGTIREAARDLYRISVRWVDVQLRRLFETLRDLELWEQTAAVVTADHGEELGDRGRKGHQPWDLPPALIRVPLLMRIPGLSGRRVSSPFSLLDLSPTLLDVLGVPIPRSFSGKSRLDSIVSELPWTDPAITEAVRGCTNPWKLEQRIAPRIASASTPHHRLTIDFGTSRWRLSELRPNGEEVRETSPEHRPEISGPVAASIRSALFRPRGRSGRSVALRAAASEIARRRTRQSP